MVCWYVATCKGFKLGDLKEEKAFPNFSSAHKNHVNFVSCANGLDIPAKEEGGLFFLMQKTF